MCLACGNYSDLFWSEYLVSDTSFSWAQAGKKYIPIPWHSCGCALKCSAQSNMFQLSCHELRQLPAHWKGLCKVTESKTWACGTCTSECEGRAGIRLLNGQEQSSLFHTGLGNSSLTRIISQSPSKLPALISNCLKLGAAGTLWYKQITYNTSANVLNESKCGVFPCIARLANSSFFPRSV